MTDQTAATRGILGRTRPGFPASVISHQSPVISHYRRSGQEPGSRAGQSRTTVVPPPGGGRVDQGVLERQPSASRFECDRLRARRRDLKMDEARPRPGPGRPRLEQLVDQAPRAELDGALGVVRLEEAVIVAQLAE